MGKVNPELTRQQRAGNRLGPSESHQTMWAHFSEQTLLWCKGSEGAFCGPNFHVNLKKNLKTKFYTFSDMEKPLLGCCTPLHCWLPDTPAFYRKRGEQLLHGQIVMG